MPRSRKIPDCFVIRKITKVDRTDVARSGEDVRRFTKITKGERCGSLSKFHTVTTVTVIIVRIRIHNRCMRASA